MTAENSQIRVEVPKPPVFSTPSRTVSSGSDSCIIITDSADQAAFECAPFRGPGHIQPVHDNNQHNPTIYDTPSPHADLTAAPAVAQGITRPPSPRSDLPEERPQPTMIATPLGSWNLDGANGSPPPDKPRNDAGPSQGILEAETSTTPIPGPEPGPQPRFGVPDRGGEGDIGVAPPRSGMRRIVPGWGTSEGKSREKGRGGGNRPYLPIPSDYLTPSNKVEGRVPTPVSPTQQGMRYTTQDGILILIQRSRSRPSFERLFSKLSVRNPSQLRSSPQPGSSRAKNEDGETRSDLL